MNIQSWCAKHLVNIRDFGADPESDAYPFAAIKAGQPGLRGEGSTEFAACYALARKLQVEPPNIDEFTPQSFKDGMADIEAGRTVPMEVALTQPPPLTNAAR